MNPIYSSQKRNIESVYEHTRVPDSEKNTKKVAGEALANIQECRQETDILKDKKVDCEKPKSTMEELLSAARNKQWERVSEILDQKKDEVNINFIDKNGNTLLVKAIQEAQWNIVKKILSFPGVNVNIVGKTSSGVILAPLLKAVVKGQWDIVETIIECPGVDVNIIAKTPSGAVYNPLLMASMQGQWDIVNKILSFPDVNVNIFLKTPSGGGYTPLVIAAIKGQWDIVDKILEFPGVNVNFDPTYGPHKGRTPLWLAAKSGKWEIVKKMLEILVKVDPTCSYEGAPPLWLAMHACQWEIVKKMLTIPGFNVNPNSEGLEKFEIPLLFAMAVRRWKIVKTMLTIPGCNVNVAATHGVAAGIPPLYLLRNDMNTQKGLVAWLVLLGATVDETKILDSKQVDLQEIADLKQKKANILEAVRQSVENTYDFDLPLDIKKIIALKLLFKDYPELKDIPYQLIDSKLNEAYDAISMEKSVQWFSVKAFAWWRKECLGILEPNHTKFSDFIRLWGECFLEYHKAHPGFKFDRNFREELLAEFKKSDLPLKKSEFAKILSTVAMNMR